MTLMFSVSLASGQTLDELREALHDDAVGLAETRGGDSVEIERAMFAAFEDVAAGRTSSATVDLLGDRFRLERIGEPLLPPLVVEAMRAGGRAACEADGSWVHSAVGDVADPNGDDRDCYARTAEALRGYAAALLDEADELDARVRRGHELGTMCETCGDPEGVQCCEDAPVPLGPAALAAREAVAA